MSAPRVVGRYAIFDELAHGGMASVHLGRLRGAAGFARTVAIKRLHAQYARDPAFVSMLVDEARLAARIRHPNVVPVLDVVTSDGELFLVMEYVVGETISRLIVGAAQREERVPVSAAAAMMCDALRGLHAAHEAVSELGEPLGIVHRDVSPQNVIVGADGVARVFDFGVAKAVQRSQTTHDGVLKGKIGYMSPEQLHGERIDRRSDIYAAGVLLWEVLVGQRLFLSAEGQPGLLLSLTQAVEAPSSKVPALPPCLDAVVLRALERDPRDRFQTAWEMAQALEACVAVASPGELGAWARDVAADALATKARLVARIESGGELSALQSTGELPIVPEPMEEATELLAPVDDRAAHPRARIAWSAATTVLVGLGLAGAWSLGARHSANAPVPAALALSSLSAVAAPSAPAIVSDASASVRASPAALPVSASASVSAPPRPKPPPRASAPSAGCTPPFTLDEAGHKHYKHECFR